MAFKFERLEVWQLAIEFIYLIYALGNQLPKSAAKLNTLRKSLVPDLYQAREDSALYETGGVQ